jgi:hypothetical protein
VIAAVVFTVCAALLCVAAVLALLGVAHLRLSAPESIERDGMVTGMQAPRWHLRDSAGVLHSSPPAGPLQLIVFADHSIKSFTPVLEGLRELLATDPATEVVLLLRQPNPIAEPLLAELGLAGMTVLTGSPALYADYNVRVGPFLIFVDSAGLVRGSSLVNYDWQVTKLRQLAGLPVTALAASP